VINHGLPRKSKAQAEPAGLARGHERLEDPVANFRSDPWPSIANLNQDGTVFNKRGDSNGPSVGHDIERIHEQVDKDSLDALAVDRDHQILGYVLNDLHRLSLRRKGNVVHRAGYQLTKVG
jgi:hypothetical protein